MNKFGIFIAIAALSACTITAGAEPNDKGKDANRDAGKQADVDRSTGKTDDMRGGRETRRGDKQDMRRSDSGDIKVERRVDPDGDRDGRRSYRDRDRDRGPRFGVVIGGGGRGYGRCAKWRSICSDRHPRRSWRFNRCLDRQGC